MRGLLSSALLLVGTVAVLAIGCGSDGGGITADTLPEIEVAPSSLVFPASTPGATQTLQVSIKNVGTAELVIDRVYLRDEGTPFTFGEPTFTTIPVGGKSSLSVSYLATEEDPLPTSLLIESNAANSPIVEIPISVTTAGSGLVVFPNPVDFGEVLGGETKVIKVTINNASVSETTLVNAYIQVGSSTDFSIFDKPTFPIVVPAQEAAFLDIGYTPTGGDEDTGTLVVAFNEAGVQQLITVSMLGKEVGPEINVNPPTLDFGWVAVDDSATLDLTVFNMGEHQLKISDAFFLEGANADLRVDNPPETTIVLKPGENHVFKVTFAPKSFFPTTAEPIGTLIIANNDNDESEVPVLVYGNIDAPFIRLEPSDKVDFGIVAQNWTIERTVTVTNVGHAPLVLSGVEIPVNTPDEEFEVIAGTAENGEFVDTVTIEADQSVIVRFAFTNDGPASGMMLGKSKFLSNDPINPEVLLDLVATRGGQPECKLGFVPGLLDFGTVAHGASKSSTMFIKNVGSGYCTWKGAVIRDCTSFMGLMTQCTDTTGPSALFKMQAQPIAVKDGMAPGTSAAIPILYTPPATVPFIPIFEEYNAWMQVNYEEPYSTGNYVAHKMPEPNAQGTVNRNIRGSSGVADIAVLPPEIDFGLTTIGCYSQTISVKVYNAGTAPLQITDIYLDGCGPEFALKNYPPLPVDVNPSSFKEVSAVYLPQNPGVDKCYMIIESSDLDSPQVKVPLTGEGTWDTEHTDYFTQISGKKVDILFVIDESGSMCDEQDSLAQNISALTNYALQWDNDFQIGITLTNIDADYDKVGHLLGTSMRYLTNTTIAAFPGLVDTIGCGGSGKQEAGLEGGRRAISPPLITDTDIPCTCGDDQPCPGVCADELRCVKGKCGGYNRGFLRPDATLEVVFLSDEEDQSPGSVPFYIDFYKSIKGFLNTSLFHAHAICGPSGGCGSSQQSGNDGADHGERYIAVQEATGGKFGSICDDDYASTLAEIGEIAFGLQVQFFLTANADPSPGSIKVWLDRGTGYQECTTGWEFNQPTNSVVFNETGTCMPVEGDKIKIWYKMVCFSE